MGRLALVALLFVLLLDVLLLDRPAHAQDDPPPTFASANLDLAIIDDAARPAFDAARSRCPDLPAPACFTDVNVASAEVHGDRVHFVAECGGEGNGGDFLDERSYDYDLATCRGVVSIAARGQGGTDFEATFDVFALGAEAPSPLPSPPGELFVANDPRFGGTQYALTTSCDRAPRVSALGLSISPPLIPPHDALSGPPPAEPATHLTVAELRAIGVAPRLTPQGPGRLLRAYRTTPGVAAGEPVLHQGDYDVIATECITVVQRTTGTYRRVLCSSCTGSTDEQGPFAWIEAEGPIAFATVRPDWSANTPAAALVAIDLERGTAHAIDVADDEGGAEAEASVANGQLTLGGVSVPIADLLTALRGTSGDDVPTVAPSVAAEPSAAPTEPMPSTVAPAPAPAAAPESTSACGCRVGARAEPPLPSLGVLLALALWRRRR